jgi:hypothetical protein
MPSRSNVSLFLAFGWLWLWPDSPGPMPAAAHAGSIVRGPVVPGRTGQAMQAAAWSRRGTRDSRDVARPELIGITLQELGLGDASSTPIGLEGCLRTTGLAAREHAMGPGLAPVSGLPDPPVGQPDAAGFSLFGETIVSSGATASPSRREAVLALESWIARASWCRPWVFLILGVVLVRVAAPAPRPWWQAGPDGTDAGRPGSATGTTVLTVGDEAILEGHGSRDVWLARDDETWDAMVDACHRLDTEDVALLMAGGGIIRTPNGTRVEVLRTPDFSVRVCIREGLHQGTEARVRRAYVRHSRARSPWSLTPALARGKR